MHEARLPAFSILVASALLAVATPARADTLNVPGDEATIQGAIDLASSGDVILVAPGTYVETIDLLGKQLVIEGTGGAELTIIDAAGGDSAVTAGSAEPAGTRLIGFTLRGGTGQVVEVDDGLGGTVLMRGGGGAYAGIGAHLELTACIIAENTLAAAQFARGGGVLANEATVAFTDCTFTANSAQTGAAFSDAGNFTPVTMSDCVISGNTATTSGGSALSILSPGSGTSITDCLIIDNVGHGMRTNNSGFAQRCTFQGNTGWGYRAFGHFGTFHESLTFLGNGLGGLLCLQSGFFPQSGDTVRDCLFVNDTLRLENGDAYVENCTLYQAVLDIPFSQTMGFMTDCIFRGHSYAGSGDFSWTYCNIEGLGFGLGNIDADPLWADPDALDFRLLAGSPCIDTGDPTGPLDADGSPGDMGTIAFENAFQELGGGVPGSVGPVHLAAQSTLVGGEAVVLALSGTPAFQPVVLILGTSQLAAPFKGGTLWPSLDAIIAGLATNGSGQLTLSTTWPAFVPSGFSLWAQVWYPDAGAIVGFAGSNGVKGTVP